MRRAKKVKDCEARCLRCLLGDTPCHSGTLKGNCIACGGTEPIDFPIPFDGFFNKDLETQLLSLAREPDYAFLNSDEDFLEFSISTFQGLSNLHRLVTQGNFLPSNNNLKYQLDQIVWLYYIPNIRCRTATTSLITSALFGRGYLSILFICNVREEIETFPTRIRLLSLILTRLDESISEVVNAFDEARLPHDERYWAEVSASLAILYPGLLHAQEGLKGSAIQPICGGAKLADIFAERIDATLAHLTLLLRHRNLRCDPKWASILNGPLEDLQSNVKISLLCFRTMKQTDQMSTRSLSTSSSASGSICASSIAHSSTEPSPLGDPGTIGSDTSGVTGCLDTGPTPSLTYTTNTSTPLWNRLQGSDLSKHIPYPFINDWEHNSFPPLFALPYGNTFNMIEFPPLPNINTSQVNGFSDPVSLEPFSQGNGCSDLISPEPFPNLHLGMLCIIPSEKEQIPSHVSGPLLQQCDTREETSVWASRDPFPDLQYRITFMG